MSHCNVEGLFYMRLRSGKAKVAMMPPVEVPKAPPSSVASPPEPDAAFTAGPFPWHLVAFNDFLHASGATVATDELYTAFYGETDSPFSHRENKALLRRCDFYNNDPFGETSRLETEIVCMELRSGKLKLAMMPPVEVPQVAPSPGATPAGPWPWHLVSFNDFLLANGATAATDELYKAFYGVDTRLPLFAPA
jgi:hypothetical protein